MSLLAALLATTFGLQAVDAPAKEPSPLVPITPIDAPVDDTEESEWPNPRQALWILSDEDTTIYLFGTVHMLPEALHWRSDPVVDAMVNADELVTEAKLSMTAMAYVGVLAKLAFNPSQPPVKQRLDPDLHEAYDEAIGKLPFAPSFFDKLDSWAVASLLGTSDEPDTDYFRDGITVPEMEFAAIYDGEGKPHHALEHWREQMHLFDSFPPASQKMMLESALRELHPDAVTYKRLLTAWLDGDTDYLGSLIMAQNGLDEGAAEVMLYSRNRNWADWLDERLDRPGSVFVAVGALHLAGEKSVIDYLEQAGHTVTRIQ